MFCALARLHYAINGSPHAEKQTSEK
jgi:hypothetical protein